MRILRHYTEFSSAFRGGVVALGNFDGVHLGHRQVIRAAQDIAKEKGVGCGVMTFEPHPRLLFQPNLPPFRLTPFRIKARIIESLGVDYLLQQHFDEDFASLSADEFIRGVLAASLGVSHVVIGYDYRFGQGAKGDETSLRKEADRYGFGVTCIPPVMAEDGTIYASTNIREALKDGNPREAARLLGHPWEIENRVEHGDQRGRTIGFPTANIELADYQRPKAGVYAVRAALAKGGVPTQWFAGVANYGSRPTFGKTSELLEVHLFDFNGDLYGQHLRVALIDFLRPEQKFDGLEALKAQIEQDCQSARRILDAAAGQVRVRR